MKMTIAAHTPGPWTFYADLPSTDPNWHIVTTENRLRVLANVHIEPGNEADLANARLIAAAPELLDALQEAKHMFAGEYPGHPTTERIFAAIEKATGAPT